MNLKQTFIAGMYVGALLGGCATVFGNALPEPKSKKNTPTTRTEVPTEPESIDNLTGEWTITSVGERAVAGDDNIPYIHFDADGKRFYGSNGCNILNGLYRVERNKITFYNVLSTMQLCDDAQYEADINRVLSEGNSMALMTQKIGNETYLYFNNSQGRPLMTLVRHNMQFLNGNWRIVSVGKTAVDDDEANIFFDIASRKVHGNTGCNYFNGDIIIDAGVPNSLGLCGMGVTRRGCNKGDQEREILVALEETVAAVPEGKNQVIFVDADGKQLLKLKRTSLTNDAD